MSDSRELQKLVADRRAVLRAAGLGGSGAVAAVALAACGGGSSADSPSSAATSSAASSEAASSGASSGTASSAAGGSSAKATVAVSKVPEGGGVILDSKYVVTQPTSGTFKAFTAICTHQQCPVTKVEDGKIKCPCHGSEFNVTDGEVAQGPATEPLQAYTATVSGSNVEVS